MLASLMMMLAIPGVAPCDAPDQSLLPGFTVSEPFAEQVRWTRLESGVRVFVNARGTLTENPRRLIVFATPNGNSIEQTLGCQAGEGIDGRCQIQHVAAQIRRLQELRESRDANSASQALEQLRNAAATDDNLMPSIISCVEVECTLGEVSDALRAVFGVYQEQAALKKL